MRRLMRVLTMTLAVSIQFSACSNPADPQSGTPGDAEPTTTQVGLAVQADLESEACRILPGAEVVRLVGGTLTEERLIKDPETDVTRCVYLTADDAGGKAFVFWLMPAEDYSGLKEATEDPIRDIAGLGDEAYITYHADAERFDLVALKRGRATVEITGPNEPDVRALVAAALKAFGQ